VYRLHLSAKTNAANAALVGLGNTRRIVLGDTLLDNYTDDEVETIFAHELGHHVHGDIPNAILMQSFLTLAGLFAAAQVLVGFTPQFGITSPADIASLPLLTLTLGLVSLLTMPMANAFSRWSEREADRYAIEATGNASAFKTAMIKLTNQNLAELNPGWIIEFVLYDHPSTGKRIAFAEDFEVRG
jgi:STE24 endopeptidase